MMVATPPVFILRFGCECYPNIGEGGYRLEVRHRGEYQSFVTLVESKPNRKIEKSRSSYSTSS